jgi:GNAT superfamily N-acetyltransferase
MLIPCLPENPDQVVGAVDVKKGQSYDQDEPESTEASIWRKRVDQIVQRRGLGHTLMQATDDYARTTLNCKIMGLWTGNPIAADFYVKKAGCVLVPGQLYWYDAFNPHLSILLQYDTPRNCSSISFSIIYPLCSTERTILYSVTTCDRGATV